MLKTAKCNLCKQTRLHLKPGRFYAPPTHSLGFRHRPNVMLAPRLLPSQKANLIKSRLRFLSKRLSIICIGNGSANPSAELTKEAQHSSQPSKLYKTSSLDCKPSRSGIFISRPVMVSQFGISVLAVSRV